MIKRLILYCLILSTVLHTHAQELKFTQPIELGQGINSGDEELAPMLSPDGQTLYFSRAFHSKNTGGKYAGTDIWISRKDANGNWTPAVNAGKPWNNKRSNAVIGISQDGSTVYLTNAYNNRSGISFSRLVNGVWTKPEFISIPGFKTEGFLSAYVSPDFEVIILSMSAAGSRGEEDLYFSLRDSVGTWSIPKNIGPSINTSGFEIAPFLSSDKAKLYFTSNGHVGYGDADIYVSERQYGTWDIWTVPRNLGTVINSSGFDAYFSVYADTIAYYSKVVAGGQSSISYTRVSYVSNVLPSGSTFLSEEELNAIYPKRISTRMDYNKGITTLSSDQNEILWFVANRVVQREGIQVLVWVREEEDSKTTLERTTEIIRALRLTGLAEDRISVSTQRVKPEQSKSGGGVIEILLYR